MQTITEAILRVLLTAGRDLHEAGETNGEYTRGQANLIQDACGLLPSDAYYEVVTKVLTHEISVNAGIAAIEAITQAQRAMSERERWLDAYAAKTILGGDE